MQELLTGSPLMCFIGNAAIRICPYGRQSSGGPWSHRHCGSPFPPQGKLMAKSFTYDRIARQAPADLIEVLRAQAEPLPAPQPADELAAFFARSCDPLLVLLGEAPPRTPEFSLAPDPN